MNERVDRNGLAVAVELAGFIDTNILKEAQALNGKR